MAERGPAPDGTERRPASTLISAPVPGPFQAGYAHSVDARMPPKELSRCDGNADGNDGNRCLPPASGSHRPGRANVPEPGCPLHLKSGRSAVRPRPGPFDFVASASPLTCANRRKRGSAMALVAPSQSKIPTKNRQLGVAAGVRPAPTKGRRAAAGQQGSPAGHFGRGVDCSTGCGVFCARARLGVHLPLPARRIPFPPGLKCPAAGARRCSGTRPDFTRITHSRRRQFRIRPQKALRGAGLGGGPAWPGSRAVRCGPTR